MKKFGNKLKMYRSIAQLTQEQVAEKCNCSSQTISGAETGYSFPSSKTLFRLSQVLNVPLVYLFNFEEDEVINRNETSQILYDVYCRLDPLQQEVIFKVMSELAEKNKKY